jgi:hypothetical protein
MTFTIQGVQLQMGETTTYRHMGYKTAVMSTASERDALVLDFRLGV